MDHGESQNWQFYLPFLICRLFQYVAFAAAGLLAGFFVDAHHLNKEHEAVSLGLHDENRRSNQAQEEQVELNIT